MTTVANLSAGRTARAAGIVVPAVLILLGSAGVVVKPKLGFDAARTLRHAAQAREDEFGRETQRARDFEAAGGQARLAEATAVVRRAIPTVASPLELHGMVTLTGRHAGLELQTIEIGPPTDTTFESVDDRIVATEVSVKGRGTLSDVVRFTEDLRAAGCAVSVIECSLARTVASATKFEFRLSLSFHHRAEATSSAGATQRGDP